MRRLRPLLLCLFLLTSCIPSSGPRTLLSPEIMDLLLNTEHGYENYYSESLSIITSDGEEIDRSTVREWHKVIDGQAYCRMEYEGQRGEKTTLIDNDIHRVIISELPGETPIVTYIDLDDEELDPLQQNHLMKFDEFIRRYSSTHTMNIQGQERLSGRDTLHIVFTPKDDEPLGSGEQVELWVDEETFYIVKNTATYEDDGIESQVIYESVRLEIQPVVDDGIFKPDLPEEYIVENDLENGEQGNRENLREHFGSELKFWSNPMGLEEQILLRRFSGYPLTDETLMGVIRYLDSGQPLLEINLSKSSSTEPFHQDEDSIFIHGQWAYYYKDMNTLIFTDTKVDYLLVSMDVRIGEEQLIEIADQILEGDKR